MDALRIAWHQTARWFQPPIATMRRQRLAAGHRHAVQAEAAVRALSGARLAKFPGAGHAVAIERPTEPYALVLEFTYETSEAHHEADQL